MIEVVTGNILEADCDALVNPVNCVGVMGAGLARAMATRWPGIVPGYRTACRDGSLRLGTIHAEILGSRVKHRQKPWLILNFPTKLHWRNPSTQAGIQAGLDALAHFLKTRDGFRIQSLAVPALGCGLGGLDWSSVRPMIEAVAGEFDSKKWRLYAPESGEAARALDPNDMSDAAYLRHLLDRLRAVGWMEAADLDRLNEIAERVEQKAH